MVTIYLVRHAESAYNPDEYGRGLTEKGMRDAEKVVDELSARNIDFVLSSPYRRAINTVEGIAKNKDLEIVLDERFRERCLSSAPVDDFYSAVQSVWDDPSFAHLGGESNNEATARGITGLNSVLEKYNKKKEIVIGTHGNLMAMIMSYYHPRYHFQFWRHELKMPDIYGLSFEGKKCVEIFHVPIELKSTNNSEK